MCSVEYFLLYLSIFMKNPYLAYNLRRLVHFSLHKGSHILMTEIVKFNHPLFLLYHSTYHRSVL